MAINVQHNDLDPALYAQAISAAGRSSSRRDQDRLAHEIALQELRLEQQQQQFDASLDQRAYDSLAQRQLARDNLSAQLYNQQLAAQRTLLAEQMQQQGLLDRQALAQQGQLERQLSRGMLKLQADREQSLDGEANELLKEMRQRQLDPEGLRHLHALSGDLRAIQSAPLRSEARQAALDQWFRKFHGANLDQYEIKEPTPDELWSQQTHTDETGAVYGLDRSGNFRKLREPPPRPLTQEEVAQHTTPLPNGGFLFINPLTGKETVIPPEKEEKPLDYSKYTAAAHDRLAKKHAESGSLEPFEVDPKQVADEAVKLYEAEQETKRRIEARQQSAATSSGGVDLSQTAAPHGKGTADDPLDITRLSPLVARSIVLSAPSGTVFVDEQGRRFAKP